MVADTGSREWPGTHHPALDGMRGAAILVVIAHNAGWILGPSEHPTAQVAAAITASGWLGVQIFFVLSGFLITGLLLDARGTPHALGTFYVRRAFRIFPLYYAFLIPVIVLGPTLAWDAEWAASVGGARWWYVFYLSNWIEPFGRGIDGLAHLWSLAVEEQFYLAWPLLVLSMARTNLLRLCVLAIIAGPAVRWALIDAGWPTSVAYEWTFARWDALAMGAALALIARDERGWTSLLRLLPGTMIVAGLSLIVLVVLRHGLQPRDPAVQVIGQSLVAVLSTGLVAAGLEAPARAGSRIARFFADPWLRSIGRYSYAMYLFHLPLHLLLQPFAIGLVQGAEPAWRTVALAAYLSALTGITYVLALISWRVLEQPCLRLRDRLAPAQPR